MREQGRARIKRLRSRPPSPGRRRCLAGSSIEVRCRSTLATAESGPVPVQMWQGWSQSRCRCGRGGPNPGGDVAETSPVPVADVAGNKGASPAPLLDDALDDGPRGSGGGDTERDGLIGIRTKDLRHAVSSGAGPFLDRPSLHERAWEREVLHGACAQAASLSSTSIVVSVLQTGIGAWICPLTNCEARRGVPGSPSDTIIGVCNTTAQVRSSPARDRERTLSRAS